MVSLQRTIDGADDSKISNRIITTNRIPNRKFDSKSNRISKLRRSLIWQDGYCNTQRSTAQRSAAQIFYLVQCAYTRVVLGALLKLTRNTVVPTSCRCNSESQKSWHWNRKPSSSSSSSSSWAPAGFFSRGGQLKGLGPKFPSRVQWWIPVEVWNKAPRSWQQVVKTIHK